jgi:hypothetical protein
MTSSVRSTSIDEARLILADLKSRTRTPADCISHEERRYEVGYDYLELVQQFGYRAYQWLQVELQVQVSRFCSAKALKQLAAKGTTIALADESRRVAIARKWRSGCCSELTSELWFQRADFVFTVTGPCPTLEATADQLGNRHAFVISGTGAQRIKPNTPLQALFEMVDLLVIDPLFNFVCQAGQLQAEGKQLLGYWKSRGHCLITELSHHQNFEQMAEIVGKNAELLHQESESGLLVNIAYCTKPVARLQEELTDTFKHDLCPLFHQALSQIVPKSHWIGDLKGNGDYELTTPDHVTETAKRLAELGIPHQIRSTPGSADQIALRNPDPELLTIKALSEDAICSWTGLQAPQVRLILRLVA